MVLSLFKGCADSSSLTHHICSHHDHCSSDIRSPRPLLTRYSLTTTIAHPIFAHHDHCSPDIRSPRPLLTRYSLITTIAHPVFAHHDHCSSDIRSPRPLLTRHSITRRVFILVYMDILYIYFEIVPNQRYWKNCRQENCHPENCQCRKTTIQTISAHGYSKMFCAFMCVLA